MSICKNFECKHTLKDDTCKFTKKNCYMEQGCIYKADCEECKHVNGCKDKVTVKIDLN